jgi:hypothetical protein
MAREVYRHIVQVGTEPDLGRIRLTNAFYWILDNNAGLNSYAAAADLSDSLGGIFGWRAWYMDLQVIGVRFREWTIKRVLPTPGALFDDSRQMYTFTGSRIQVQGVRFLTTRVSWFLQDGRPTRTRTEIGFSCKADWDDDEISTGSLIDVHEWATAHTSLITTPAGNTAYAGCRRSDGKFWPIIGFRVEQQPGRRLTRRENV